MNEIVYKALANSLSKLRMRPGKHAGVEGIDAFDKVIEIDQRPIGRTPRSNPATYTDLFTHIRELYSLTPDAKVRGYKPGRFSFNVKGGRCEACKGDGQIKIEMHFLPDVYVPCETCKGKRYNHETLEVRFKGKTIADILEMSVEEALAFFIKIPKIRRRLQTLHDVGLDYMTLGQPATTLSGGEAQRVKLASELCKVSTGRTLYILDEPTTGLHFADIEKLLETLQRLVDAGNTMLVIEHNLDVIKQADYLIDLGPEGGEAGGEIVAAGTPEEVAQVEGSYTGQFLRSLLGSPARRRAARRRVKITARTRNTLLAIGAICAAVFVAGMIAAFVNRHHAFVDGNGAARAPDRHRQTGPDGTTPRRHHLDLVHRSERSNAPAADGADHAPSQRRKSTDIRNGALMRDWWLRTLLVLQRPRPVFVALRDESPESLAIVPSRPADRDARGDRRCALDGHRRAPDRRLRRTTGSSPRCGRSPPAASTARADTSRSVRCSTRRARARLAGNVSPLTPAACFAAVPVALSLVVWPVKLALYGEDVFRARRRDCGAGAHVFAVLSACLPRLGSRAARHRRARGHGWSWSRSRRRAA